MSTREPNCRRLSKTSTPLSIPCSKYTNGGRPRLVNRLRTPPSNPWSVFEDHEGFGPIAAVLPALRLVTFQFGWPVDEAARAMPLEERLIQ